MNINIKSFHIISFIFSFIVILELAFIALIYFGGLDFQLTNSDYIESIVNVILGGSIAYGIYNTKMWGFICAITLIPLSCIYSMYDAVVTNNSELIFLYGGGMFAFYGYILLTLIQKSPSIFYNYNWISTINKELLFIPKLMFCISLYFTINYFFDNMISIFIVILFFLLSKPKGPCLPKKLKGT